MPSLPVIIPTVPVSKAEPISNSDIKKILFDTAISETTTPSKNDDIDVRAPVKTQHKKKVEKKPSNTATASKYNATTPNIQPPSPGERKITPLVYQLIKACERSESPAQTIRSLEYDYFDKLTLQYEKASEEQEKIFKEYSEQENRMSSSWDIARNVGSTLLRTGFIATEAALGIAAISGGIGPALVASASASFINELLDWTGGWDKIASWLTNDKEKQKTLSTCAYTTISLFSLGSGLLSATKAYQLPMKVQWGKTAKTWLTKASAMGRTYSSYIGLKNQAATYVKRGRSEEAKQLCSKIMDDITSEMQDIEKHSQSHNAPVKLASEALKGHAHALRIIASAA
jgi:hypothetical protein